MPDLISDLRLALRGLRKRPAFFVLIVATLALGIGANVSIFGFIQALLLRPLPFTDPERLVRIEAFKGAEPGRVAQREIEDLQRSSQSFQQIAAYYHSQYNVTGDGAPEAAPCAINTHNLFEVLGRPLLYGDTFAAKDDFIRQYRVVLGHDFWQRRFGSDPAIVGQSITLDGGSYVVDGVLAPGMDYPPGAQLYRQVTEYHGLEGRRHSVIARLAPGVDLRQAQQELQRFSQLWQTQYPASNRGVHFEVVPLRDVWAGAARPYLVALMAAAGFVLLIAVVNVLNLLLSRSGERRQEMALRMAIGASRGRLVRLLLTESLLLAFLGGLGGVLLAVWWTRALTAMVRADLPPWMTVRVDPMVLLATVALVLAAGLLSGLTPALRLARSKLGHGSRASDGPRSRRLAGALVVAEVALALVLLLGGGLMIRSFVALQRQPLGFDAQNLFTVRVDPPYWSYNKIEQLTPFFRRVPDNLRAIPGVEGVAANQNLPLAGLDENTKRIVTLEGQSATEQEANPFIHLQSIGPGYFEVMGIPQVAGRSFTDHDRQETQQVAVISQALAERLWPTVNAIGRRLKLGPPDSDAAWLTIVGVVEDVRSERRVGAANPDLYVSHFQHFTGDTFFALRTSLTGAQLVREVESAIQAFDADLPIFNVAPMAERVARAEWRRRVSSTVFLAFGLLALTLAGVGIYGVISQMVARQVREMGVRLAFGARPADLFRSVMRHGLRCFLWGSILGLLAAAFLLRLISSLLFGVELTDPLVASAAWGLLLLVALAACLIPAWRAARLDPLTAIRQDS
ncbi:MAG: ABC transporter permease [Acidobacteriota bacterium]